MNAGECKQTLNLLKDCGYMEGLLHLLVTDTRTGIIGNKKDLLRRQKIFGKNNVSVPRITGFLDLFAGQFEDSNVIMLIVAATIYLAFSLFAEQESAYMETLTIYGGVFFSTLLCALSDWIKEKQFLKIKEEMNNNQVVVFRG